MNLFLFLTEPKYILFVIIIFHNGERDGEKMSYFKENITLY